MCPSSSLLSLVSGSGSASEPSDLVSRYVPHPQWKGTIDPGKWQCLWDANSAIAHSNVLRSKCGSQPSVLDGEAEKTALPTLIQEKLSILSLFFFSCHRHFIKLLIRDGNAFQFYLKGTLYFTGKDTIHVLWYFGLVCSSCTDQAIVIAFKK